MSVRIPGLLVNRALRSRLVAAQQYRLAGASPRRLAPWTTPTSARPYSAPSAAAAKSHDHHDTASDPAHSLPIRWIDAPGTNVPAQNPEQRKREGDFLFAIASSSSRKLDTSSDAPRVPRVSRAAVMEELKWLSDPSKLARRVAQILANGEPAKAAAIVREAPKQHIKSVVAWGHLLDYCLERGHTHAAFRFYNDMKKRHIMPISSTYTIMLSGMSKARPSLKTVKIARSIYESIAGPNSQVERSVIHTNAMLSVCHRHGDMNMLWAVAADMPEEGIQAPNMTTYTIILAAIQFSARNDIQAMAPHEINKILDRKAKAVRECKRVWADILYRWEKGHLELDNHVVSAMARDLLDGASDHDCHDVLKLYNQAMGIPILQDRPSDTARSSRRRILPQSRTQEGSTLASAEEEEEQVPFVDETNQLLESSTRDQDAADFEEDEETFVDLFNPLEQLTSTLTYPQPNNRDLTMILDACHTMTQAIKGGMAYWNHLTLEDTEYRIQPDSVSFMQYLRLLRLARASRVTIQLLQQQMIPSGQASGKAFFVAMSTCRRDRRNHAVLTHANDLLSLMGKSMLLPDPRVLEGYLDLVQILSDNPQLLLHLKGIERDEKARPARNLQNLGKDLQARLRIAALAHLRPHISTLLEAMEHGKAASKTRWSSLTRNSESISGALAAKIMARTRLLVDENLKKDYSSFISKQERKLLESESQKLRKYSDQQVIEKFRSSSVHATVNQKIVFKERQESIIIPQLQDAVEKESQRRHLSAGQVDGSTEQEVVASQANEQQENEASHESEEHESDHPKPADSPVEPQHREA